MRPDVLGAALPEVPRHSSPRTVTGWRLRLAAYAREPLWRFLVIGALLFGVAHAVQSWRDNQAARIVIDAPLVQHLIALNRAQTGLTPRGEQLDKLIDDYVDDEARYREALRQGLDRDDEIVRRRLVQKMMFVQHDLATPSTPDEQALREYYEAHTAQFTAAPTVAFEQIYFSPDRGGWDAARHRARNARTAVERAAAAPRGSAPRQLGDPFPQQLPSGELTREQLRSLFGDTPIVTTLFSGVVESWSEPVRSGLGWHLVQVTHRDDGQVLPFEQARSQVEAAWGDAQTASAERHQLDALRAQYTVVRAR